MPETKPRRIRSISTGPRPTLMTWPPMPQRIGFVLPASAVDGCQEIAKIGSGENVRKRV